MHGGNSFYAFKIFNLFFLIISIEVSCIWAARVKNLLMNIGVSHSNYFITAPSSLELAKFYRTVSMLTKNLYESSFNLPCIYEVTLHIKAGILITLVVLNWFGHFSEDNTLIKGITWLTWEPLSLILDTRVL